MAKTVMDVTLSRASQVFGEASVFDFRNIKFEDVSELGRLLYNADLGTVDDEGKPLENSISEIEETIGGRFGNFLANCSFAAVHEGVIVAAVLVTFYPDEMLPLIAFTMTHPLHKNKGLCQQLLKRTFHSLKHSGYERCFLAVNSENKAAVAAYEKVGFKVRV